MTERKGVRGSRTWRLLAGTMTIVTLSVTMIGAVVADVDAASSGPEVGVVSDITWGTSQADVDRTVSSMLGAGIRWVRANVSWSGGEPDAKGVLNEGYLKQIDYAVSRAREAGMQVLMPIADGVPYWASADPGKYANVSGRYWDKYWRPSNFTDYADFVRAIVSRYKTMGVHTYELWNEPNLSRFWPSGPNAAEFRALLSAAYPVVKATDPSATVLLGGLSKNDYGYLQQLYSAGGRSYFDAVAVHPYTGSADPTWCWNQGGTTKLAVDAFCAIEEVRRTMESNGDSAKSIWLTEFGWSTYAGDYGVSEATQGDYLKKAFTKLQSYPYVRAAFWYNFRNTSWLADNAADYEANLGLLRTDFSTKPAYAALQSYTASSTPPPPAADTQAPLLSKVLVKRVTSSSAVISWSTNENADSRIEYWAATPGQTVRDARLLLSHQMKLTGLARRTKYSYRVASADAAGNAAVSGVFSFTTSR